jgi:L-rhamnonate dehydratase
VLNTISGVDLALWDLLGKWRQEPVYQLLGGFANIWSSTPAVLDLILRRSSGFSAGKSPLPWAG